MLICAVQTAVFVSAIENEVKSPKAQVWLKVETEKQSDPLNSWHILLANVAR
jgi:hypothetical protein